MNTKYFATTLLLLTAHTAGAQSIAMAPAEVIAAVTPGQPVRIEFSVSNPGDRPVAVRSSVTDLWYNDNNEKTFGTAGSSPRSAANWIQFVPRLVTIEAHSTARLTAFITPPAGIRGGYYAVAFVESKPVLASAQAADAQPVYANIRLGALILLNAENTEQYAMRLSDVNLTPPTATEALKATFTIFNDSNVHLFPKTTLAIFDRDAQLVARAEADPRRFLPGQTQPLAVNWSGKLAPGDYDGVLTVVYGNKQIETRTAHFTVAQ